MSMRHEPCSVSSRREKSWRWATRRVLAVRGRRACVLVAILTLPMAVQASAASTTLYVDQNNASCSDSGSGSGTASQPYCTISAAVPKSTAGTTVQVSAGTYNEQVSPRSGAAGAPVTFAAEPGETVTVRGGKYGFYISNRKWVTVQGFMVTETTNDGIHISDGAAYVKIVGNRVSYAGKPVNGATAKGISVTDSNDSLLEDNTVDHNSNYGIYLANSARNQIVGNQVAFNAKVYSRAASGIRLHGSDANTVAGNVSHDNEDSGIEVVTGSDANLVVNNVGYGNGDHGIDVLNATGQRVVSNSIYNNLTAGINAEGGSTGTTLANNISVDNGIGSPRTKGNIRVDAQSTSGTTIDYDVVHLRSAGTLIVWGTTAFSSLATFTATTGQESRGIDADPLWTSPASGDLHLMPGSPAIDSAASGTSGQSATDADGNGRVDHPATPNTGTGPRGYDDRGAYEFQLRDAPPAAELSVTPSSGLVDLDVTADASGSTDNDVLSPIASYTFDFGDGSAVVGPQPQATAAHTYTSAGTYTVTVTVTDTAGLSSTATQDVTVTDDPPVAVLTVTPSSGPAPLLVTADASGSSDTDGTPIESYTFEFGDGSAVVGPQPEATAVHTYTGGGTFTVTVEVTDTAGLSSTASTQVTVQRNFVENPGFETGLSGWNTSGGGANISLSRVAGGHSGGWAAKMTNTGTTGSTCTLNDSPNWVSSTAAGTYTGTLWARADLAGAMLKLRFREYSGSTLVGSATMLATLTTSWQQVTVTYTAASPGSSTLDYNAYVVSASPGTCFYADDVSIYRG